MQVFRLGFFIIIDILRYEEVRDDVPTLSFTENFLSFSDYLKTTKFIYPIHSPRLCPRRRMTDVEIHTIPILFISIWSFTI